MILIITSFSGLGLTLSHTLCNRVEVLRELQKAVEEAKDSISYSRLESKRIIENIKNKHTRIFEREINREDKKILDNFLSQLGSTDTASQLQFCNSTLNDIKRNLADALKDKNEKSKLYATLGICAGISVSILIF